MSLTVPLPGASPSSRYWCWTVKLTCPVVVSIDVMVRIALSVDELNVSPTFSVAVPAAFWIAVTANVESRLLFGSSQSTVTVWASNRPMSV